MRIPYFLLLLLAAAPSAAQQPAQAYVGCYRILQGSWDPHLQPGFHPSPRRLPPAILLDSLPLTGWPMEYLQGALQARSLSLPDDSSFSFRLWQRLDADTLFVATPMPFTGFYLKVAGPPTRLQGRVTAFTDVVRENITGAVSAPVVLERIECAETFPASRSPAPA